MNYKKKIKSENKPSHTFCTENSYIFTLLAIIFDRKFTLVQRLQHQKLEFKSFLMIYYIPTYDNRARNDYRLNFACVEI